MLLRTGSSVLLSSPELVEDWEEVEEDWSSLEEEVDSAKATSTLPTSSSSASAPNSPAISFQRRSSGPCTSPTHASKTRAPLGLTHSA